MANDALFLALANAKSQPDKWSRAVNSAGHAGQDIIGGYMQGKQIGQQLDQYKLLSTPLGSMYPDASKIPFGLSPQHTVKDLLTIAPALENYASPETLQQIFGGGNSSGAPPASISTNPSQPQGTTAPNSVQGTVAGNQGTISPGQPLNISNNSPTFKTGLPSKFIPMIMTEQNQRREGAQFQQGQANENIRAQLSREQSARQHQESLDAEAGRARAGVAEKTVPLLNASAQLEGSLNQLEKINSSPDNLSIPFTGNLGARYAEHVPSTTSKWALNQKAAQSEADVAAGAIERAVEGRYNDEQMQRIRAAMIPTGNELGTPVATQKLNKLRVYVQQLKAGAVGQANAALDSIAGGSFNPNSSARPIESNSSSDPLGLFQ